MEEPPLFYAGQRSQGLRWPEPEKSDDSLQSGHHILGRMSPFHIQPQQSNPPTSACRMRASPLMGEPGSHNMDPQVSDTIHQYCFRCLPPRHLRGKWHQRGTRLSTITTSICVHASTGTYGVFMEIKSIIIIILLYTIFLEFYPPFTFDFLISSVCRCFNIFPSLS